MAFFLGKLKDLTLKMKKISDCPRLLCAAPSYLKNRYNPKKISDLTDGSRLPAT